MQTISNPQLELASEFIQNTNKNIFLTGKAGTGKTTFLHQVKQTCPKRLAVVAPTGVAAINAKGMTIHSLFQLPFGPIIPGQPLQSGYKFSQKKVNLLRGLDLLIIDEISMVRADLLDGIDAVLRRYKDRHLPFGGAQLLMIGDLHQLPPVVKDDEWRLLSEHYTTPYFFGSLALQETDPIQIELKHIYRQSDNSFIYLLNKVRNNQMDQEVLEKLNSRYQPDFQPSPDSPYIILTSHNRTANGINGEQLGNLQTPVHTFDAEITGKFPEYAYPTEEKLYLKKGAQVMFVKNDISQEKLYYNGKIGKITRIKGDTVYVQCPNEAHEISVTSVEWSNRKYKLNETSKELEEEIVGIFNQHPLKLAWAITIHKSQGLTFDRAIIDANAAFAHGQVYVALSRCRSFEGIVLRSKLDYRSIKTDQVIRNYSEEAEKNPPTDQTLTVAKKAYQESLVRELFNFKFIERGFDAIVRLFLEYENTLTVAASSQFQHLSQQTKANVIAFAVKFRPQLETYFQASIMPEDNEELQGRIKKASAFFSKKLSEEILPALKKIPILTDNQKVKKRVKNNLKRLQETIYIKNACFKACAEGFVASQYMVAKSNAAIDFTTKKKTAPVEDNIPTVSTHPELYRTIVRWRKEMANKKGINAYEVLHNKVVLAITHYLPTSAKSLNAIKGVGRMTIQQYGGEILNLVEAYCQKHQVSPNQLPAKPQKVNTREVSLKLFKSGKNIEEIAVERSLTGGTIAGHLSYYIAAGSLSIYEVMEEQKVAALEQMLTNHSDLSFTELRVKYNEQYSYQELRMVSNHLKSKKDS